MNDAVLERLQQVDIVRPADLILTQLRNLITSGVLRAGQKLPSERELSARFGVGRGHVREALLKLEFYGVVKTLPQSGTVVADLGVRALEGLIANVLALQGPDLAMVSDVRKLLETHSARRAAECTTPEMLEAIAMSHRQHEAAVAAGRPGMEEDIVFHLKVAEASGNKALMGLIGLFAADLIKLSVDRRSCEGGRAAIAVAEHAAVLAAIERHDGEAAALAMHHHLEQTRIQFERTKPERGGADKGERPQQKAHREFV